MATVKVEPEGQCWLCGNLCSKMESDEEDSLGWGTCFKMLLRYLNVDDTGKLGDSSSLGDCKGVRFCEECGVVMKEFLEWYQSLEAVRLCLGNIIVSVSQILRRREDFKGQVNLGTSPEGQLDALRNKLIVKCQDKLLFKPRVQLSTVTIMEVSKPELRDTTTLKKEETGAALHFPNKVQNEKTTCKFCNKKFSHSGNAVQHSTKYHTFLHFSSELPPGTTEPQLKNAIDVIFKECSGTNGSVDVDSCFRCVPCKKIFRRQDNLHLHVITSHFHEIVKILQGKSGERFLVPKHCKHQCVQCKKSFKTRGALYLHKKCHKARPQLKTKGVFTRSSRKSLDGLTPVKKRVKKTSACKFCSKVFYQSANACSHSMQQHTFLHFSNQLPSGTTKGQLEKAVNTVTGNMFDAEISKNQKCSKCQKNARSRSEFRLHTISTHFDDILKLLKEAKRSNKCVPTPTSKKIDTMKGKVDREKCKFCSRTFICKHHVNRHSIDHHTLLHFSQDLPLGMTQCQLDKVILSVREKNVEEETRKCLKCKKTFAWQWELRFHILKCHWKEVVKAVKDGDKNKSEREREASSRKLYMNGSQQNIRNPSKERETPPKIKEELTPYFPLFSNGYLGTNLSSSILPIICNTPQASAITQNRKDFTPPKVNLKGHICSYCDRTFQYECKLNHHVTTIHTRELFDNVLPKDITDKQLRTGIWGLIKSHSDKNKFSCSTCPYANSNSSVMKVHILQNHIDHVITYLRVKREAPEEDDNSMEYESIEL